MRVRNQFAALLLAAAVLGPALEATSQSGSNYYNYCSTAPNSAGSGALISATGTTSVAANDLVLHADGAPADVMGLFFFGLGQVQYPFGDGYLCVNPLLSVFRSIAPPDATNSLGQMTKSLDLVGAPGAYILAGTNWNFQFWYRDQLGPLGSTFNLSDGLSATFVP